MNFEPGAACVWMDYPQLSRDGFELCPVVAVYPMVAGGSEDLNRNGTVNREDAAIRVAAWGGHERRSRSRSLPILNRDY